MNMKVVGNFKPLNEPTLRHCHLVSFLESDTQKVLLFVTIFYSNIGGPAIGCSR